LKEQTDRLDVISGLQRMSSRHYGFYKPIIQRCPPSGPVVQVTTDGVLEVVFHMLGDSGGSGRVVQHGIERR
jgi:hypothetical protein